MRHEHAHVAELLDALPAEAEPADSTTRSEVLQKIYQRLASRRMPTGSLARCWSLSGLHARIGVAYFAYWMRSWFQTKDEREQQLVGALGLRMGGRVNVKRIVDEEIKATGWEF